MIRSLIVAGLLALGLNWPALAAPTKASDCAAPKVLTPSGQCQEAPTVSIRPPDQKLWTEVTGDDGQTYDVAILHPPGASIPLILLDDPTTGMVMQYGGSSMPSGSLPVAAAPVKPGSFTPVPISLPPSTGPPVVASTEPRTVSSPTSSVSSKPPPPALTGSLPPTSSSIFPAVQCLSTGAYSVANGQVIGPDGKAWNGQGINIYSMELTKFGAQAVMDKYPGMKLIRINTFDLDADTPEAMAGNIQKFRAAGVAVELEDHNYPTILTGGDLAKAADWYGKMAAAFKNDPGVIFGTPNEPSTGGSIGDIQTEINTIYQAIRGAGNNSLIMIDGYGGYTFQGFDPNFLADKKNVAIDHHFYAWEGTDAGALLAKVDAYSAFQSADGMVPVLIGEYGPAAGNGIDQGGAQVVDTVMQSGLGSTAWAWRTYNPGDPGPGDLTTNGGSLTSYGQTIASHVAAPSDPALTTPLSQVAGTCDVQKVAQDILAQPPPAGAPSPSDFTVTPPVALTKFAQGSNPQ